MAFSISGSRTRPSLGILMATTSRRNLDGIRHMHGQNTSQFSVGSGGSVGVRKACRGGRGSVDSTFQRYSTPHKQGSSPPPFEKISRDLLAGPLGAEGAGVVLSEEVANTLRRLHERPERVLAFARENDHTRDGAICRINRKIKKRAKHRPSVRVRGWKLNGCKSIYVV